MTRWRVRCAPAEANGADGGAEISPVAFLESFAKGRVGGAVAEALARNAEDGPTLPDRFRARFYLRLFARTLETFRDEEEALLRRETKVPENDERFKESVARWFASNASALIHTLVLSVPNGDGEDATLRRDAARADEGALRVRGRNRFSHKNRPGVDERDRRPFVRDARRARRRAPALRTGRFGNVRARIRRARSEAYE
jgi:hypothetical protein